MSANRASIFRTSVFAPLLLLATCALLLAAYRDRVWSNSLELVQHYALVTHAAEFWLPSAGPAASFGAPNWSHAAAAMLGGLLGSHFLGMHLLALVAVLALWCSLATLVTALPRAGAFAGAGGLVILMLLVRISTRLPLSGQEVAGAYLFSQLLAQALALGIVCCCMARELRAAPPAGRYGLLLAGALICAQASVLPALQLLVLLLVLLALDGRTAVSPRRLRVPVAALTLAGLALLGMWRATPPADVLDAAVAPYSGRSEALLCVLVALASTVMLRFWLGLQQSELRRAYAGAKYLGALGLAVAASGFAHLLALKFGLGPQWSTVQPAFALDTMALLDLACLPALLIFSKGTAAGQSARAPQVWLAPLLLAAGVASVLPPAGIASARAVATLEQQVRFLRLTALPDIARTADYTVDLARMPPAIDAMLSLGVLKAPYRDAAQQLSDGHAPADLCSVGTLITSPGAPLQAPACVRPYPASTLVMLDASCVRKLDARQAPCGGRFDFRLNGNISAQQIKGFGEAEPQGRWTIADMASFTTDAPAALQAHTVVIDTQAFVPAGHIQHLRVRINGVDAGQFSYDQAHPQRTLRLALPRAGAASIGIDFIVPDALSPAASGLSADARRLAISVRSLQFE